VRCLCVLLLWYSFDDFSVFLVFEKLVLVGAFSDFGMVDTGNPVQILACFTEIALILEN